MIVSCDKYLVRHDPWRKSSLERILINRQIEYVSSPYDALNAMVCARAGINKRAAPEYIRECEYTGWLKQVRLRRKMEHKSRTE